MIEGASYQFALSDQSDWHLYFKSFIPQPQPRLKETTSKPTSSSISNRVNPPNFGSFESSGTGGGD
jgi:hypothetical protein